MPHTAAQFGVMIFSVWAVCCAAPSFASPHHSAPTDKAFQASEVEIRDTLHQTLGDDLSAFLGFTPEIRVVDQAIPNAYARAPGTIILSRGLLEVIENRSQLAFVIAHEIGHLMLHQPHKLSRHQNQHSPSLTLLGSTPAKRNPLNDFELEADEFAVNLLRNTGFNAGEGPVLLTRLGEWGSSYGTPLKSLHPSIGLRLISLRAKALLP